MLSFLPQHTHTHTQTYTYIYNTYVCWSLTLCFVMDGSKLRPPGQKTEKFSQMRRRCTGVTVRVRVCWWDLHCVWCRVTFWIKVSMQYVPFIYINSEDLKLILLFAPVLYITVHTVHKFEVNEKQCWFCASIIREMLQKEPAPYCVPNFRWE